MFDLTGKVIRMCSSCNAIYVEPAGNLTYIKSCKKCDGWTGFFETTKHFYRNVDLYGVDLDRIFDKDLRLEVEAIYGQGG